MNASALYVCLTPRRPIWQLGTPIDGAPGALWLIGWSRPRDAVDAAVPAYAATAIAAALASTAQITFLAAGSQYRLRRSDSSSAAPVVSASPLERLSAWTRRFPADAITVTTCDAQAARDLFDAAAFDWNQQRQLVLLTAPGSPGPTLTARGVDQLCGDGWIGPARAWAATTRGLGVMRPGVDGDVAGLLCLDSEFAERFRRALTDCAAAVHASVHVLDEEQFIDRMAPTA